MSKKAKKNPPAAGEKTVLKQSVVILTAITFVAGFLAGVGFSAFKTQSVPGTVSSQSQSIDYVQRAKMLEAEVERNPNNSSAWTQLGHIYFDTDQYAKAIIAYEKALEQDPGNADLLTDLGVMYRRSGQSQQAIEKFNQAIAADAGHETARLNKGIVLLHDLEDRQGAIRAWEELLAINPLAMAAENQSVDQLVQHYKEGHDTKTTK